MRTALHALSPYAGTVPPSISRRLAAGVLSTLRRARKALSVHARPSGNRWLFGALVLALPLLGACNLTPRLETSADTETPPYSQSSLVIRNAGGGTLTWQASIDNPYIELRNSVAGVMTGGTLGAGQSIRLFLRVDGRLTHPTSGVNGTVSLASNGGHRTIPVSVGTISACQASGQLYSAHYEAARVAAGRQGALSPSFAIHDAGSPAFYAPDFPVPVGNEIIVSYNHRSAGGTLLSAQSLEQQAAQARTDLTGRLGLTTVEAGNGAVPDLLVAPPEADIDRLLAELRGDPRVAAAQRNYYIYLQQYPQQTTDPYFTSQWALTSFGVPQAWTHLGNTAEREVVLAVLDSGVDSSHPDLAAKMLPGFDFFRNSALADPVYVGPEAALHGKVSHGTHVAGIAAAMGNGLGIIGVAYRPEVKILPVKVFDDCGDVGSVNALVKAIYWAAGFDVPGAPPNPHPADIINLSLGAPNRQPVLDEATSAAFNAGSLVIAASGNHRAGGYSSVLSPANGPDVLAVGSVDEDRVVSDFSNHGPQLNVVAPGGFGNAGSDPDGRCGAVPPRVISTVPHAPAGPEELGYGCMVGTSMAAPFVAGVAALIMLQDATATAADVRNILTGTALLAPHMTNSNLYGVGLVCADAALGAATTCGAP